MKRLLMTFGFMSVLAMTYGQETEPTYAEFNADEQTVSLDTDTELQPYYLVDVSELGITSKKSLIHYCGYKSNNLITYSVEDYSTSTLRLTIHADRTYEPQDVAWWNSYLSTLRTVKNH